MEYMKEEVVTCEELPKAHRSKEPITCNICEVTFITRSNLNSHMMRKHSICQSSRKCYVCAESMPSVKNLHCHLAQVHGVTMQFEEKVFYSKDDFAKWKSDEEKRSVASYIRKTGTKVLVDGSLVDRYECSRGGKYSEKPAPRKKVSKFGGSIKCGVPCPAGMKVVTKELYGGMEIMVEYCTTHVGHDLDARKLRLQDEEKAMLAARLKQGYSKEQIINEVTKDFAPSARLSLLRRKDLTNLCQSKIFQQMDEMSVEEYANKVNTCVINPILLGETQIHQVSDDFSDLPKEEYIITIVNEADLSQLAILQVSLYEFTYSAAAKFSNAVLR